MEGYSRFVEQQTGELDYLAAKEESLQKRKRIRAALDTIPDLRRALGIRGRDRRDREQIIKDICDLHAPLP